MFYVSSVLSLHRSFIHITVSLYFFMYPVSTVLSYYCTFVPSLLRFICLCLQLSTVSLFYRSLAKSLGQCIVFTSPGIQTLLSFSRPFASLLHRRIAVCLQLFCLLRLSPFCLIINTSMSLSFLFPFSSYSQPHWSTVELGNASINKKISLFMESRCTMGHCIALPLPQSTWRAEHR